MLICENNSGGCLLSTLHTPVKVVEKGLEATVKTASTNLGFKLSYKYNIENRSYTYANTGKYIGYRNLYMQFTYYLNKIIEF